MRGQRGMTATDRRDVGTTVVVGLHGGTVFSLSRSDTRQDREARGNPIFPIVSGASKGDNGGSFFCFTCPHQKVAC